ncbi:hypothetical protein M9Y10_017143 [Tritrichomonas musculus]|uniref:Glycosyltransferase 61 catalytic domain-containing protein n=1 Tax=Tritrichomonas musculus TaxID=1915356 RepID=A0ABR2HVA6_9EUKA
MNYTATIKFPSSGHYNFSLLSNNKILWSSIILVKHKIHNSLDSFFDCKKIRNSLRCWISNACLSNEGISIFGYLNTTFNYSLSLSPTKEPCLLRIINSNFQLDEKQYSTFSDVVAVFADLQSLNVFYHSVIESFFPISQLILDENILDISKVLILPKKTQTRIDLYSFMNMNVKYLEGRQCYKKIVLGLPYFNANLLKFKNLSNPIMNGDYNTDIFNENSRTIFRKTIEKYLITTPEQLKNNNTKYLLFLNRPKSSRRTILNYKEVLASISSHFPNWIITYTDFTGLTLRHQIKLILQTDIFLTIHGSALTHLLFLNDNAIVIEIMPYLFSEYVHLYQHLAEITKIKFFEFKVCKNSSIVKNENLRTELEKNGLLFKYYKYIANIRDQSIIINETEIYQLINLLSHL